MTQPGTRGVEGLQPAPHRTHPRSRYSLAVVSGILFLFFAAAAAPSPLLPLLLTQWHFAPWLLTFAFAIYALAILLALLTAGRLSDHVGRRPVILAAVALELASMLVFWFSGDIWAFVIARTMQGLATGAATGALSAAIADLAGERRQRLTATLSSVAPLSGLATGALFAGTVAEFSSDPKPVTFFSLTVVFTLGMAAAATMRESSTKKAGAVASLTPRVAIPPAARPAFWRAVPIAIAVWMAGGFYLSVVGESVHEIFGIHDQFATSLLIGGLSATGAVTVVLAQRLRVRVGAAAGALMIALGLLFDLFAVQTAALPLLILGTIVSGAGFGMAFAGAVGLVIPHARAHERAELFSAIYVVNYLAFGIPAIIAGLLIAPLGLAEAVIAYAAVAVVVAIIGVIVQAGTARAGARHVNAGPH